MNIYNLIMVQETTIATGNMMSTGYIIPVDDNNVPITNHTTKNRVIKDNQMYVFDTEQEYTTWISENF